jgi:hypothetical protein
MNSVFLFKKSSIYVLEGGLRVWESHFVIIPKTLCKNRRQAVSHCTFGQE